MKFTWKIDVALAIILAGIGLAIFGAQGLALGGGYAAAIIADRLIFKTKRYTELN